MNRTKIAINTSIFIFYIYTIVDFFREKPGTWNVMRITFQSKHIYR